jgi:putative transposase
VYRTQTFRLDPTAKQRVALQELLDFQREVYNSALEERRGAWSWEKRHVTRLDQYRILTGLEDPRKERFGVVVTRGTLYRLDRAFQNFFRRCKAGQSPGFPRFKSKQRWDSVEWSDHNGWTFTDNDRLRLMGVGHIRITQRGRNRVLRGTPKTLVVGRKGRRWEATVFCEVEKPEPRPAIDKRVGLDLGIVSLVTTSDGKHIENPRWFGSAEEKLTKTQRERERHTKGSHRWRRANCRVALSQREAVLTAEREVPSEAA